MKLGIKIGEIAVICDFSENYFLTQDFQRNNARATLHPFMA
jgi:hypothetical protein